MTTLNRAPVGARGRTMDARTRHSVLSVTVQVAGRGSDGCGVGVGHSFAELGRVASEECPTGITELGVQLATYARPRGRPTHGHARFRASSLATRFSKSRVCIHIHKLRWAMPLDVNPC